MVQVRATPAQQTGIRAFYTDPSWDVRPELWTAKQRKELIEEAMEEALFQDPALNMGHFQRGYSSYKSSLDLKKEIGQRFARETSLLMREGVTVPVMIMILSRLYVDFDISTDRLHNEHTLPDFLQAFLKRVHDVHANGGAALDVEDTARVDEFIVVYVYVFLPTWRTMWEELSNMELGDSQLLTDTLFTTVAELVVGLQKLRMKQSERLDSDYCKHVFQDTCVYDWLVRYSSRNCTHLMYARVHENPAVWCLPEKVAIVEHRDIGPLQRLFFANFENICYKAYAMMLDLLPPDDFAPTSYGDDDDDDDDDDDEEEEKEDDSFEGLSLSTHSNACYAFIAGFCVRRAAAALPDLGLAQEIVEACQSAVLKALTVAPHIAKTAGLPMTLFDWRSEHPMDKCKLLVPSKSLFDLVVAAEEEVFGVILNSVSLIKILKHSNGKIIEYILTQLDSTNFRTDIEQLLEEELVQVPGLSDSDYSTIASTVTDKFIHVYLNIAANDLVLKKIPQLWKNKYKGLNNVPFRLQVMFEKNTEETTGGD